MEQVKRISLDNSISWIEECDQLGDNWATDGLLDNASFSLEKQTPAFLPPPPSLIEAPDMNLWGSDGDSVFYDDADVMMWEGPPDSDDNGAYYYKYPFSLSQIWEERRRDLAFSIQRSQETRAWIDSNMTKLCGQNTKMIIHCTLQSTALMETVLELQRDHRSKRKREV